MEREYLARSWAGHSLQLQHARLLAQHGSFRMMESDQAVWLIVDCKTGVLAALRLLEKDPHVSKVKVTGDGPNFVLKTACLVGDYEIRLRLTEDPVPMARATVRVTTRQPAKLDPSAREILATDLRHRPLDEGLLFTTQTGSNSGHAFVAANDATVFYFQNLTALGPYSALTGANLRGCVGVEWPALGLCLPSGERPLPKGVTVVISDAFLRVTGSSDRGEATRAVEFLEGLAWAYRKTAPPPGKWFDWTRAAERILAELGKSRACVRKIRGKAFLNAYVGSDDKPPESMVQAAVQVALCEYEGWQLEPHPLMKRLEGNLEAFFLKDLGTMARWLPGEKFLKTDRGEEQETERMDSWYLLHTMMNLGRLAASGKKAEQKLFLECLEYTIKTAHHFQHDWPVFYHRKTLKVLKREVAEGLGGERDAAGLYAHVMLQAWDLTADRRYLGEAEAAASKLTGLGFGMLYQTNNTVHTAVALARLWKATGNSLYRELSLVCMASVLSHLWMWEPARPGNSWSTYMGLPPLHDAPYIAPYEEAEVFAASRVYLSEMGDQIPLSLVELWVEYGKHLISRAAYYLPEMLPADGICDSPHEGVIDRSLPVPLEDLYASVEPAGQVGQELYGAGLALTLATRTFHRWHDVPFMVWAAVPLAGAEFSADGKRPSKVVIRFKLVGPESHRHGLRIIPNSRRRGKNKFKVWREEPGKRRAMLKPVVTKDGHFVFEAAGSARIEIVWLRK
ncbi:hypothetical protein [Luteolibacter soli]|uniref:Uncharacterized protein n=1 Tax=Luteolibacter soli TaxID=3135280 RepID=A0ABU9AZT3_9BACT